MRSGSEGMEEAACNEYIASIIITSASRNHYLKKPNSCREKSGVQEIVCENNII